jgi:pimeloyl-ACP methyl ester carboxylesterase
VEPSTLSLLGLVRHMAEVERIWFRQRMAGQDATPHFYSDTDPDGDFDGAVPDPEVVAEAWNVWRAEVAFTDRFVAEAPDLDVTGNDPWRGPVSLRWVLVHMVEEYARHNGHADLLRERIGGRVGQQQGHRDGGTRRIAMIDPAAGEPRHPDQGRQIRFVTTPTGVRVAYATVGRGPALVVPAAWIGHLEVAWQDPAIRVFYAPLAACRTVVTYDKPGCGLSDPWPAPQTLDSDLEVLRAVTAHLELDRVDLLGISMGAPVSLAHAVRHPERVGRLILYGGFANGHEVAAAEVRAAMIELVRAHWGLGSDVLADIFLPDGSAEMKAHFARLQRRSATAEVACELLAQCYEIRVDDLLDRVAVPTLVLHRRADRAIPYRLGRDLAAGIPGARLVSLAGRSHWVYAGDSAAVVREILEFLGASQGALPAEQPERSPGTLTARQLQVAALIADGLTNREIAGRLGIEERSAEGHVERIRQRLGVRSRTQIAAWWASARGH